MSRDVWELYEGKISTDPMASPVGPKVVETYDGPLSIIAVRPVALPLQSAALACHCVGQLEGLAVLPWSSDVVDEDQSTKVPKASSQFGLTTMTDADASQAETLSISPLYPFRLSLRLLSLSLHPHTRHKPPQMLR